MSLNKFDRDLDLLAELIHKTGHIEGDRTVIQFDHLIEIPFETEGIGDSKIQHPWARGVSVPTFEEYEGQESGEAVHVEFDRIFPVKFADIKQYRASFAQLDDKTVKMLWDEAIKGDQIDEDGSNTDPEEDENNMKNETIMFFRNNSFDANKVKACPKCGAVNITFNHPAFDGGSYVSCCNCNYAPQKETWADSDWEALIRWNNLPKEEAPYNCEDTEETAKDEKTQEMNTKDLIDNLVKDKMSEDQVLREHSCMSEDELYIRDYIRTFGTRYAKNFWAIKFASPIDLSNGETAAGIGFHGKGRVLGIGGYHEGGGMREFDFWMLNDEDKQALADQLPFGNCGLFAFERHEPSDIEEESMFHKSPETIRKYIRDNGHVPKGQLCPACKFKKPVKVHLRYKETAMAVGMCCPEKNNGGPWVLLDCDSSKCGAPEVDWIQLVDSDKFKCCDQLTQGDAGEFDWENEGPMEKEPDLGQNNYLHVEMPEVKVKHGTVLRDGNGNSWLFLSDNLPTPEFKPLYLCCRKVDEVDENTVNITTTKVEEGVTDEKEEDEYTARDLMLITKHAIMDDLAKLKPVVKNIIAECIKHAEAQRTECEVAVDLGSGMTADKANKIEKILKDKGFRVHWKMGEPRNFQGDRHVFCIDWGFPVTELEAHQ